MPAVSKVRYWMHRVEPPDIDLFSDLARSVSIDTVVKIHTFDLRMPVTLRHWHRALAQHMPFAGPQRRWMASRAKQPRLDVLSPASFFLSRCMAELALSSLARENMGLASEPERPHREI
jgi:hypothetical protein